MSKLMRQLIKEGRAARGFPAPEPAAPPGAPPPDDGIGLVPTSPGECPHGVDAALCLACIIDRAKGRGLGGATWPACC